MPIPTEIGSYLESATPWRLQRAFPGVRIILCADAGFSLPEILQVCERSGVGYAIGFTRNAVTERKIADLLERARLAFFKTGQKARLFDDVYAAASWAAPRQLVMKAEWLPQGPNPRLMLTNLEQPPQALYDDFYVQRGAATGPADLHPAAQRQR